MPNGKVFLIGAGPGDPELLTLKGKRLLQAADSVLYDHLAPETLLEFVRPGVERVYVGKKRSSHAFTQQEISAMLVARARAGRSVVRLKGGDPFIFGRGGEEIEALAAAGIEYEVVPGVTTPLGVAAYCGVPLTHRDHTSVVSFVTGHNADLIDWDRVGHAETLVVFMGLTALPRIAREIRARGRAPETPAMAVRWATRPDQETVVGTLETLPALVERHGLKPPATIVIGEVVRLREQLNWFEKLPLFGRRVVVTRARSQAAGFGGKLRELGAAVIGFPVIEIRPAADFGPLDRAIAGLDQYDWLIFTSVNGVEQFIARLDASGRDLRNLRARLCAIGPATAGALAALHLKVDRMPAEYVAESLVEAFAGDNLKDNRILLPRAAMARDTAPGALRARGAIVDVVEAYRTAMPESAPARAVEIFGAPNPPDWITFTSSSTVTNFVRAAGLRALDRVKIASIGPVTSATCRRLGLNVAVEASPFTTDGLIEAILRESPRG